MSGIGAASSDVASLKMREPSCVHVTISIPFSFPGPNIATTEDVLVDNRGFIYMDTMQQGLFVLRCTV